SDAFATRSPPRKGRGCGWAACRRSGIGRRTASSLTPTAELADIVLPVAASFEREGLKIGFEITLEAQSFIQLRPPVVPPPGEARLIPTSSSIWLPASA